MNRVRNKVMAPLLAAGLAGLAVSMSTGPSATAAGPEEPKFSGYSATTTASPMKLEIFEPTIPIPNSPQAEVQFGYTRIIADTSSARGRASFLWPGDAVGEGSKTIVDNIGLPKEIADPIAAQGYPAQVNSGYPSGPEEQAQEPFPGTVMFSRATKDETVAQVGYSSRCDLDNPGGGEGGGEPPIPLPDIPGLPELPDLPGFPPLDQLMTSGSTSSGSAGSDRSTVSRSFSRTSTQSSAAAEAEEERACPIPPELGALVSFGGYGTLSKTQNSTEEALSKSRSAVSDVILFGGVVSFSGVSTEAVSKSDGTKPVGKTAATYGTVTIGGEEFAIGPDGVRGGGQGQDIPSLPNDPNKALADLGLNVTVPEPVYEQRGQQLKSTREGLIITIDSKTAAAALRQLPLQDLIAQLPEDMKEFKKVLQAAVNLSPRFVLHLAYSSSKINTVQPLDFPSVPPPDNDPGDEGEEETETDGGGGATTGGGATSGVGGSAPSGSTAPAASSADTGALEDAALASGLPPLFSIPMLLIALALGGAAAAGSYVRRVGALTLGSGAACAHGLTSGLPDLRKIQ